MIDFARRGENRNSSAGGLGDGAALQKSIEEMRKQLQEQPKQEEQLTDVDAFVGRPDEKLIPRECLVSAPSEWNFFPPASDAKIIEISESIRRYGLFHNITVWEQDNGQYMILGGHTRVACFDYLAKNPDKDEDSSKWASIPALVYKKGQLTKEDAQRIIIVSNTDQRQISTAVRAESYKRLFELEKKNSFYGRHYRADLASATMAKVSIACFYRYLNLLKLIRPLQQRIDSNELSMVVGYNLSFLPENLQQYIFEKELYVEMSVKAAEQIKNCTSVNEIEEKLTAINNAPKYYKYTIQTKIQKPRNKEVVPFFAPKGKKDECLNLLVQTIETSNTCTPEQKEMLLDSLKHCL